MTDGTRQRHLELRDSARRAGALRFDSNCGVVATSRGTKRDDELVHDATHDALSGLLNRRAFDAIVERGLMRLARRPAMLAVLFIDLDGFKSVNDRFGHGVGDVVLRAESNRLASVLRAGDNVARVGGDEFVILCEDIQGPADAVTVGRRVIEATNRSFDVGGERIELGASVGIAFTQDARATARSLFDRADVAMYDAKRLGRGRIALHDGDARVMRLPPRPAPRPTADRREPGLQVATRVDVRERYCGRWSSGFDVVAVTAIGYRVRRTADRYVLPGEFPSSTVRRTSVDPA